MAFSFLRQTSSFLIFLLITRQNDNFFKVNMVNYVKRKDNMKEIRNSDNKRIFDISDDNKMIFLIIKGCETKIIANPDGTLKVINIKNTKNKN